MPQRKLRGAMIGGGYNSLIGPVHRMAMRLDGEADLVAGVFSSDPDRSKSFGRELYLDPRRVHGTVDELLDYESSLPADERVDFVTVCTPSNAHYEGAKKSVEAGFHVVSDKPLTSSLEEAYELQEVVSKSGVFFGLTHNYTGYPMVKQARHLVSQGELGDIHKVVVEYPQGWMVDMLNNRDSAINPWRMDPAKAGKSCTVADVGTHAENLVRYITGLEIVAVSADMAALVPSNPLDDDANVLLHFRDGTRGVLIASQVSTGEENGFNVRVYGNKAGMYWLQENPNYLRVKNPTGYVTVYSKGNPVLCEAAQRAGRLPFGHPDGFIEAFANLYLESFRGIRSLLDGEKLPGDLDVPTIDDGVIGMQFIETVVSSANSDARWTHWVK